MSGIRGKEYTMINKKKNEEVVAEEKKEYACPMLDAIAMITARDFDESGMFDPESPHTVLICDLIFKLYLIGLYLPFLTVHMVRTAVKKLLRKGIVKVCEYNDSRFDRTHSYAFTSYGRDLMRL